MDPFTHLMTGACLARAGFNRKAAYAAAAMTVAAELPDIDTLWSAAGPVAAFQHHRGWTHTFLGLPFEAAAVVTAVWLWHRWRTSKTAAAPTPKGAAPVRWPLLYIFVLIALLSHLALDWTNNYGLRPFFPFNPRWYAGSIVFIVEPVMLVMLLTALIAPSLFGLIGSEVGAKRARFRGRGWAIAALLGIAIFWSWRWVEKQKALTLVMEEDPGGQEMLRLTVNPYPITPYKWHAVVESPTLYQLATVDTLRGSVTAEPADPLYKPPTTMAPLIAKRSSARRSFRLDWSQYFPLRRRSPHQHRIPRRPGPHHSHLQKDLRFLYDVPFLKGRQTAPLQGAVTINSNRKVVQMEINGHEQK